MNALNLNRKVNELANEDHVVEPAGLTTTTVQEWLNVDLTKLVRTLAAVGEELEAAGYQLEGTLTISGPLNVTIDL